MTKSEIENLTVGTLINVIGEYTGALIVVEIDKDTDDYLCFDLIGHILLYHGSAHLEQWFEKVTFEQAGITEDHVLKAIERLNNAAKVIFEVFEHDNK